MTGRHPVEDRLAAVARELGELRGQVVFIGGAILPLLQMRPPFAGARPTSDVDAVALTDSYAADGRLAAALRTGGFTHRPDGQHMHRWYGPSGVPFDLVPVGDHPGSAGNPWDIVAARTAVETAIQPGLIIRHASAPALLALKWSAHADRGADDVLASHDLEDICALIASRPGLLEECAAAERPTRAFLADSARAFLALPFADDALAGHLNNATDAPTVIASVRERLDAMAALDRTSHEG